MFKPILEKLEIHVVPPPTHLLKAHSLHQNGEWMEAIIKTVGYNNHN